MSLPEMSQPSKGQKRIEFNLLSLIDTKSRSFSWAFLDKHERLYKSTYTSRIRSPIRIPPLCAGPFSITALTCWRGAYSSPFIDLSCPPSDTCPRTLNPKPFGPLDKWISLGPYGSDRTTLVSSSSSAILVSRYHVTWINYTSGV